MHEWETGHYQGTALHKSCVLLYKNPALTVVFCCFCLPQIRKLELQKKKRPRRVLNPAEVMHNRITEMRRKALEQAEKQAVQEQEVVSLKAMVKGQVQG